MADWQNLKQMFQYDLWANSLWLETLNQKGDPEPDRGILAHILSAQRVWVERCRGTSLTSMPRVELTEEALSQLSQSWQNVLDGGEDRTTNYRRTTGEPGSLSISHIAMQVINHGTYHRGELRGLYKSRNDDDFPETDFARFVFSLQAKE
jgi:uncharacterized damage-inducible protein DinB